MFSAKLSKTGLVKMGHIFTDGRIPIKDNRPRIAHLIGLNPNAGVFIIDFQRLSEQKKSDVITYLMEKFKGADIAEIREEIIKGIPILEEDVDFVEAISLRMFI